MKIKPIKISESFANFKRVYNKNKDAIKAGKVLGISMKTARILRTPDVEFIVILLNGRIDGKHIYFN